MNAIKSSIKGISSAISGVSSAFGAVGNVAGGIVSAIPGLQHGGTITRSGAALVGERGPEVVSLPRGAQVAPLGAGGGITINFTSDVYGIEGFREAVNEAVLELRRRGG